MRSYIQAYYGIFPRLREIEMNASLSDLSDGNESVIDIFILSANSLLSTQLEKQLRDEGYYVTLFSDGTHLLETLRNGKPNLLMCDTTVPEADAFEVCKQIKADDYLWNIPVLIITSASDLGDLLRVLDSNADNFIAHPFDTPFLLSLIEGTLTVPVERPTPDQIKTQFKIKHDDQVYVVTAQRRKLLEFLLSSFEIAVNKSSDLLRAQEDIRNLGITIRNLEDNVIENTRVIGILNESVRTQELTVKELSGQLSDREQTVREKITALDQVFRDLSSEKSAHADVRSELQRVVMEKDESLAAQRSTIDQQQQQLSDLSSELATLKPALERANEELARESGLRKETENILKETENSRKETENALEETGNALKETENKLSTTAALKEQAETALLALTSEYEELKINLGAEKKRREESRQELDAVLLAKNQSEQDLTQSINTLKTTAQEQADGIIRLQEELVSERSRLQKTEALLEEKEQAITSLTAELGTIRSARESSEQELLSVSRVLSETNSALGGKKKDILELEARLNTARSQVEEKEQAITTLTAELGTIRSARESSEQELASVSRVLTETKASLEGKEKDLNDLEARFGIATSLLEEKEQEIKRTSWSWRPVSILPVPR
jgi:DNA-binding response OmpR family regulator/predicted  nucleic acid-binding Zn-ribbon protein